MAMHLLAVARKTALALLALFSLAYAGLEGAYAMDCNADVAALTKKRQGVIDELNKLSKGGKSQLDPVAACPKLKSLAAVERELVAYLTKNKDWCAVPDSAVQNITTSAQKSGAVAGQACKIAAQVEKQKQQMEAGGGAPQGQKLPTGPL